MIVRTSEALVRPGRLADFRRALLAEVEHYPKRHPGLLGDEILVADGPEPVLVYLSRWVDEAALERFAGPGWRDTPVQFPGEEEYLLAPLRVRHFSREDPR